MLLSADTDAALSSAEEAESESPCNTHQVPTPKYNECQQQRVFVRTKTGVGCLIHSSTLRRTW